MTFFHFFTFEGDKFPLTGKGKKIKIFLCVTGILCSSVNNLDSVSTQGQVLDKFFYFTFIICVFS